MEQEGDGRERHQGGSRLLARLDKMVAAGRITAEDAVRLRAAGDSADLEAEVRRIRLRHATARVDEAVADGGLAPEEAEALLGRVRNGEHPRGLRGKHRR